jgi:uncharacterized membrane protein
MNPSSVEPNHESNQGRKERSTSYTGLGVALGASLGFIISILFLDGNVGFGIGIGAAVGIVIGSIIDTQKADD